MGGSSSLSGRRLASAGKAVSLSTWGGSRGGRRPGMVAADPCHRPPAHSLSEARPGFARSSVPLFREGAGDGCEGTRGGVQGRLLLRDDGGSCPQGRRARRTADRHTSTSEARVLDRKVGEREEKSAFSGS